MIAVTRFHAYSPEPYCTRTSPVETRAFSETATIAEIWSWAKKQDEYVTWDLLQITPVSSLEEPDERRHVCDEFCQVCEERPGL